MNSVVWKTIPIASRYEASNLGSIRLADTGKILCQATNRDGYCRVNIKNNHGKWTAIGVHRLVAFAFHGIPPKWKNQAAHIDGNPLNNSPTNIRWSSAKENIADQAIHGRRAAGSRNGKARISETDASEILELSRSKAMTQIEIANRYKISRANVSLIKLRRTWRHVSDGGIQS